MDMWGTAALGCPVEARKANEISDVIAGEGARATRNEFGCPEFRGCAVRSGVVWREELRPGRTGNLARGWQKKKRLKTTEK